MQTTTKEQSKKAAHTPGPWRWQLNEEYKTVHLVGGRPLYDLTIIEPIRWGMSNATFYLRDTAHDGMNLMHKLHERRDWIAPFEGRAHHAKWCADVIHPDMRLMAAAPELLEALTRLMELERRDRLMPIGSEWDAARAAIAKAGA